MDISSSVARLHDGVRQMRYGQSVGDRLDGAAAIRSVGTELIDRLGFDALCEAYKLVDGEHQRTVELEWFGLTDGDRRWVACVRPSEPCTR